MESRPVSPLSARIRSSRGLGAGERLRLRLPDAVPRYQGRAFGHHNRHRFRSRQAIPRLRCADRFPAARLRARDAVAVARQARCPEHGGACRGDLLVRASVAADVPSDAMAAAPRPVLLGGAVDRLCGYDRALSGDDPGRAEVRTPALISRLRPGRGLRT